MKNYKDAMRERENDRKRRITNRKTTNNSINHEEVVKLYFEWLVHLVDGEEVVDVLYDLHQFEFVALLEMDKNRIGDAFNLRNMFGREVGYEGMFGEEWPSIFEVMVSLAFHMNDLTQEIEQDAQISKWFWEIFDNLEFEVNGDYGRINHDICERFVYRMYREDGYGGLFPLKSPESNQREIELWYQMHQYLAENHFYDQ